jgi:hypothetical protein
VVHVPALLLAQAAIVGGAGRWQPDAAHVLGWLGLVAAVLVYAWLFSRLTERHTGTLRRWLRSA